MGTQVNDLQFHRLVVLSCAWKMPLHKISQSLERWPGHV